MRTIKEIENTFDLDKAFAREKRIRYYLGNLHGKRLIKIYMAEPEYIGNKKVYYVNDFFLRDSHSDSKLSLEYFEEMKHYYREFQSRFPRYKTKQFLFFPGDVSPDYEIPLITKTRPINGSGCGVVLLLTVKRHWSRIAEAKKMDIPYESKTDTILWRGSSTGNKKRMRISLVEKYCDFPGPEIDVGFSKFSNAYTGERLPKFLKDNLDCKEMLQHKFLISIEGNDVASNLKWIMASNSVCVMPHPKVESWLMEGLLRPWIHYVPVRNDFSDLLDVYQWCVSHPEKCKNIVKNANAYIAKFMDEDNEQYIINKVLEGYAARVEVITGIKYKIHALYSRFINFKKRFRRRRIFPGFISSHMET